MIQDAINAAFETGAGFAVLHHCLQLYRHRQVRGLSVPAVIFFFLWGLWNIYYYPVIGQPMSFAGGIFVTLANCLYVSMILRTLGTDRVRWAVRDFFGGLVCLVRGHRYDAPYLHFKCLYFCARCNHELLGRTWDDIETLDEEEREMLDQADMAHADYLEARS